MHLQDDNNTMLSYMDGAEDLANVYDIEDETLQKSLNWLCNIRILIAGMVTEELSCTLSLTRRGDIEGYDSGKLIK